MIWKVQSLLTGARSAEAAYGNMSFQRSLEIEERVEVRSLP
jgi:hypothetical protein